MAFSVSLREIIPIKLRRKKLIRIAIIEQWRVLGTYHTMERHILYLGIANFLVAVAIGSEPRLLSHPVAVANSGSTGTRRIILDVSSQAALAGVHKGMFLDAAQKICPDLVVLDPCPDLYERACTAIMHEAGHFSPKVELSKPGHFFIDLTGTERLWGVAIDAADRLHKTIKRKLSFDSAVGLAQNKLVSKIAARVVKPSGLCKVIAGSEADFMAPLPIGYLPGLDREITIKFLQLNLRRIGDVISFPADALFEAFGQKASQIRKIAQGKDDSPVREYITPGPSLKEVFVFEGRTNDDKVIENALFQLVSRLGFKMRKMRLAARDIELSIRYADGVVRQQSCQLSAPLSGDFSLFERFLYLLKKSYTRRIQLSRISIRLGHLCPPARQLDLFGNIDKEHKLMKALDSIRTRFGQDAITFCGRGSAGISCF